MLPSYTGNISKLIYRCHLANPIRKKADHGLDVRTCRSNSRMTQNQTQTKRRKAITGSCTERKTRKYFWNLTRAFLTGSHWPSSFVLRMKGHFCTNSFPRRKPVGSPFLSSFRRFFFTHRWGILSTKIGKTLIEVVRSVQVRRLFEGYPPRNMSHCFDFLYVQLAGDRYQRIYKH